MAEPRKFLCFAVLLALAAGFGAFYAAPCVLHEESLALLGMPAPPAPAAGTPLAMVLRQLVEWLGMAGVGTHEAVLGLTAGAYGLSILAAFATMRTTNGSPRQALAAAALLATCPAATVAATTLLTHALVLLLASVGTWLAVRTATRPSWPRALQLGVWLGLAAAAAPIGLLLASVLLPLLLLEPLAEPRPPLRRRMLVGSVAAVVGAGLLAALRWGRIRTGLPSLEQVASYDLGTLGPLLLREAGRAFLPLSLVVAAALAQGTWCRHAVCVLGAVLLHTLLGCHLTTTLGDDGSFLLPVLPAAVLLAGRWLPGRFALAVAFVALGLSGTKLWLRADWQPCAAFCAGLQEVAGERPYTLLAGPRRDEAFLLARLPQTTPLRIVTVCTGEPDAAAAAVVREVQQRLQQGQRVLLTDEAEQALRDPGFRARHAAAPAVLRALESTFARRHVQAQGFAAQELVAR